MEIIPFVQSDPAPGARRIGGEAEHRFRQFLAEKSKAVQDDRAVQAEWMRFCEERRHSFLSGLLGHNRVVEKLNQRGWVTRILYGRRELLGVRNLVCCETHREALQTLFQNGMPWH